MQRVIMFMFGGRRANVELQLPFIERILAEHPQVEYHLWNLAKDAVDEVYLRSLGSAGRERFTVMNQFAGDEPWTRFDDVYRYYADSRFAGFNFVKLDDDVVFIETDAFAGFLLDIQNNPGKVVSANVVNNGACTPLEPELMRGFRRLRMPLLNVHLAPKFAIMAHEHFFANCAEMLGRRAELVPTRDWLSINFIGYDWQTGTKIARTVGTRSPRTIAGRTFNPLRHTVGDEGAVNMLPRVIQRNLVVGHLYFGPQARRMPTGKVDELREAYRQIGEFYL